MRCLSLSKLLLVLSVSSWASSSLIGQELSPARMPSVDPTSIQFDTLDDSTANIAPQGSPQLKPSLVAQTSSPSRGVEKSRAASPHVKPISLTPKSVTNQNQPIQAAQQTLSPLTFQITYPKAIVLQEAADVHVHVTNPNATDVKEARLILTLPSHVEFARAVPEPVSVSDKQIEFSLLDLWAGQTSDVLITVLPVNKNPISFETQLMIVNRERVEIVVQEPKLEMTIHAPERALVGNPMKFEVTVTNAGDGPARELNLKPALGPGWQITNTAASDLTLPILHPGDTHTFQFQCLANVEGPVKLDVTAQAKAASPKTVTASVVSLKPEVEVQAFGPKSAFVGHRNVFGMKVRNTSQAELAGLELALAIPENTVVHTVSRQCSASSTGRQLNWSIDKLPVGEEIEIQWIASSDQAGPLPFQITTSSGEIRAKTITLATAIEARPDLTMTLRNVRDPVPAGEASEYLIVVENHGGLIASNIRIHVELPQTWVAVAKDNQDFANPQRSLDFALDQLPAGQKREFRFKAGSNAPGEYLVRAKLQVGNSRISLSAEDSSLVYKPDHQRVSDKASSQVR